MSPRRRLCQRAVQAWGGWTGKRSGNYAGPNGPVRESRLPPRVLSASGRRPAPTDAAAETERWTVPTGHQRPPPPLKRWTKLLPAYGAHVRYPLDEHERSELP